MVIVVPTFAVGQDAEAREVGRLNARVFDEPATRTWVVTKVGDCPMARRTYDDSHTNSPDDPRPATNEVENHSRKQLVQPPSPFQEPIPRIGAKMGLDCKFRGRVKFESVGELPQQVLGSDCV
jgi:hypothetical protein